jgi:ABC-2 type transport system permease protein
MAGAFLAIGSCISAITKNQVIAFIVAAVISFLFVMSGVDLVQNTARSLLPAFLSDAVASMSFLTHFDLVTKGVIGLPTLVFYLSMIAFFLFANAIIISQKKAA